MFVLNGKNEKPLYFQLCQQIRNNILSGSFGAGMKLASSRHLSKELCVSRNTVDIAYQQLVSEGYIVAKSRSGYYVEKLENIMPPVDIKVEELVEKEIHESVMPPRYNLQYGKLDVSLFPFTKWKQLTNTCLRSYKEEIMSYGPLQGELGLRTEIATFLREYRGVKCTVDQIIIGPGTQYCLDLACQLIRPITDKIGIENPGFWAARSVFTSRGLQVLPIPVKKHGLQVKKLSITDAKAVYVTPSHQFPTGNIMSITRRLGLVAWAYRSDGIIIEDDYSCHLRYNVKPIQALQALAPDKVIYLGSFSKILSPSIRVAYMVLPPNMAEDFLIKAKKIPCSVPFLIQKPLELFLAEGEWTSYLRKIMRQMKKKRDVLMQALTSEFGNTLTIFGGNAGLHLLIQVKLQITEEELVGRALENGVLVQPGKNLWMEEEEAPFGMILLGYGGIAIEDIYPAVQRLKQVWVNTEKIL